MKISSYASCKVLERHIRRGSEVQRNARQVLARKQRLSMYADPALDVRTMFARLEVHSHGVVLC